MGSGADQGVGGRGAVAVIPRVMAARVRLGGLPVRPGSSVLLRATVAVLSVGSEIYLPFDDQSAALSNRAGRFGFVMTPSSTHNPPRPRKAARMARLVPGPAGLARLSRAGS